MACAPQFEGNLQFECVREIIAEIRAPSGQWLQVAKKAAWVLGCAIEMIDGQVVPFGGPKSDDLESLANEVEAKIGSGVVSFALDPSLVALIIELILAFLRSRK